MDEVKLYLSLVTEEYKTLYNESTEAGKSIFTSLQLGVAILGVVIAAGFTQWNKQHAVVLLTFYIVIPIIDAMIISLWLGAVAKIKKAADYKILIEQKVGMILDEFQLKNEIKRKWSVLQEKIEKKLSIPHSKVDLSDPFAWEQWLKEEWLMREKGKNRTRLLVFLGYAFSVLFFFLVMIFSFLTGTYYILTHQQYLPSWAAWLKNLALLSATTNVAILMVLSIIIIFSTILTAFMIGRRLFVKVEPIIRSNLLKQELPSKDKINSEQQ
ncbi:MAG: hypothetical protein MUO85_06665 [candidate division Zixibacteria bacterium]|nr:hypothetical protein [candidate division Zixibacteria bacterium]